jgi:hypothetical protein
MIERTPTEFRNSYDEWKKTAPANDSDIIPDKPRFAESTRHAGMRLDLKSMLAWRETKESHDPLQTNFLQAGQDDDIFSDQGTKNVPKRDAECEIEDRPTINEMYKAIESVVFKTSLDSVISYSEYGPTKYLRKRLIPDLYAPQNNELIEYRGHGRKLKRPRVGYGQAYQSTAFNEKGSPRKAGDKRGYPMWPVTRLGYLHFSDAESHPEYPRGSLVSFRPGKFGRPITEPGAPSGLSETFFPPPEIPRLDPLERLLAMEGVIAANDNLSPEHVKTLDIAVSAQNFTVVGEAFGFSRKTAERQGKRLVLEASKAFSEVLEQVAA